MQSSSEVARMKRLAPQRDWIRLQGYHGVPLPHEVACAAIRFNPQRRGHLPASKLSRVAASIVVTCSNSIVDELS
jgi:hypothetical protein